MPERDRNDVRSCAFRRAGLGWSGNLMASVCGCTLCLAWLLLADAEVAHWFIVPVTMCGIVVGCDAADWVRGRVSLFDPAGIIGLMGIHFFFLAPLLHVHWDHWLLYVVPPPNWRDWLGAMAALNFLGLLCYRGTVALLARWAAAPPRAYWRPAPRLFPALVVTAMVLTGALQVLVYARSGGISGYISAYEERIEAPDGADAFEGQGWIFMLSESFPILAMFGYAYQVRARGRMPTWREIGLVLLAFLALKILFGGLRGSRSNTVWGLFWAVGIIHFWVRPVLKTHIAGGIVFLCLFMYIYGFYKGAGLEGLQAISSAEARAQMEDRTQRTIAGTVLGDLARSDIQAYLLYRLSEGTNGYQYALGRTYFGAAVILVPKALWPERPPHKVQEGTDAQYGAGAFAGGLASSKVYGLAGETMLNFGPAAVPLMFVVLGYVVARVRHFAAGLDPRDARWLMMPLLVNFCFVILCGDSDNVVFFLLKNGLVPFAMIMFGSLRQPVGSLSPDV